MKTPAYAHTRQDHTYKSYRKANGQPVEQGNKSLKNDLKLYPQTANENHLKIEESRLVDKIIGKQKMIKQTHKFE